MNRSVSGLLSQATFSIMLSLSLKPMHGYDIKRQVLEDSKDKVTLGPGALYDTLKQLDAQGFIEEMPFEGDPRRRYYRLTKKGWDRLALEAEYYAAVATHLASRNV